MYFGTGSLELTEGKTEIMKWGQEGGTGRGQLINKSNVDPSLMNKAR